MCLHFFPSAYQGDKYNLYSISINGKYLLNFTDKNFYDLPRARRMKEFVPLLKVGLGHNMGEDGLRDQIEIPRRQGKKLVSRGKKVYG